MYIAWGQGQTAPRGQNFDVNRKALSLYPFIVSFKKNVFEVILYNFFHDLIHVYNPSGQNFDVNRNFLSLWSSVASFKS